MRVGGSIALLFVVDVLLTASWLWAVAVSGLPFWSGSSSPLFAFTGGNPLQEINPFFEAAF